MQTRHLAAGLVLATLLAGCASTNQEERAAPVPQARVAMAGQWILSAPNASSCEMRFGGSGHQGSIEPGAGCPGDFFTSRQWTLAQGRLTIDDYQGQALAHLTLSHGRFSGRSNAGTPVILARSAPQLSGAPWPSISSTASPSPATAIGRR